MREKRLGIVIGVLMALMTLLALPAMAHSATGEGDCQGWTIELDGTFGAHTILINGQAQTEVTTEYFIGDNRPGVTSRVFTVTWDKDEGDVTQQVTATRDLSNCVNFTYEASCGALDVTVTNETAFNYAVAVEQGSVTYVLANASFGDQTFAEDYNGGSVDLFLYMVGAEADFVTGRDIPNFWEQNAVMVTVDTDCITDETTPTTEPEGDDPGDTTTTTVAVDPFTVAPVCDSIVFTADPPEGYTLAINEVIVGGPGTYPTPTDGYVWEVFLDDVSVASGAMDDCPVVDEEPTTTTVAPTVTTTPPVTPETLPFTGLEDSPGLWIAGALALLAGIGLVWRARSE